ncbi:MAG: hypothetical protein E2598_12285 [Sphingobium sp.]|nr:hypothetical protein [Sphingobium sp.]
MIENEQTGRDRASGYGNSSVRPAASQDWAQLGGKRISAGRVLLIKAGLVLLICAAMALLVWKWSEWRAEAQAGSAYAAHSICSCRYVAGRGLESCKQDAALEADYVYISDEPEQKRVTGTAFLLGSASARLKPGYGCLIEK